MIALKLDWLARGILIYGSDYCDTFSLVAKISFVRLFLSMATLCSWPLWIFHYGDLPVELYGETTKFCCLRGSSLMWKLHFYLYDLKRSHWAWFGQFSSMVQAFVMIWSVVHHSVFYHHTSSRWFNYLVVCVDDIVITIGDQYDI